MGYRKIEEDEAVGLSYCKLWVRWVEEENKVVGVSYCMPGVEWVVRRMRRLA